MRMRLLFGIILVGMSTVLAGCSDRIESSPHCRGGDADPLTKSQVLRVLASHGIQLDSEARSPLCSGNTMVSLANPSTVNEEGLISCLIDARPIYYDRQLHQEVAQGYKVRLFLANLDCAIYPRGAHGHRQARNLERALRELEAQLK